VDERSLSHTLAAEHYNLGLEAVGHVGALVTAGEVGKSETGPSIV
jgi:hypothetical protein